MKTTSSRLQKAGMETLAVLAVMFTTCFTISAQGAGFESRFDRNEELALIETIKATNTFPVKNEASAEMAYYAELLEVDNESELTVETWMTEAAYFGVEEMEMEIEEVLKVEDWMIDELLFNAKETEKNEEETGNLIIGKHGKTVGVNFSGVQFGRRTFILIEMEDEKLELEQWMVDPNVWERKQ